MSEQATPSQQRHRRWLRAAALGSTWASVEIVLGSFLHNLQVPFAGALLSTIGAALLVSGQVAWKEHGIIWRAGIVCALMKSVSPSAFIFGPMIGIASEAFVLEGFVILFQANFLSLVLGAATVVLLPFLQSLIGLLILYGFNIARLYIELYNLTKQFLQIQSFNAFDLLFVIAVIHFVFGAAAGVVGVIVGKRAHTLQLNNSTVSSRIRNREYFALAQNQKFFIPLIYFHLLFFFSGLFALRAFPLWLSILLIAGYSVVCFIRYPAAIKRFVRARLWIEFAIVTMLAGLLLKSINNQIPGWEWDGLLIGLHMIMRAAFVIMVFTALSIEMRNPIVLDWLLRIGFGRLSEALGIAFQALPTFIQVLGEEKRFIRHPIQSLATLFSAANSWLQQYEVEQKKPVVIVKGPKGGGKTTFLQQVAEILKQRNITVGGIVAPGFWENGKRSGFDIIDIQTNERVQLCRIDTPIGDINIGDYHFISSGIRFGEEALSLQSVKPCQVVILDEIGMLELESKVWAGSFFALLQNASCVLIIAVRDELVERVSEHFRIQSFAIWNIHEITAEQAVDSLYAALNDLKRKTQ